MSQRIRPKSGSTFRSVALVVMVVPVVMVMMVVMIMVVIVPMMHMPGMCVFVRHGFSLTQRRENVVMNKKKSATARA